MVVALLASASTGVAGTCSDLQGYYRSMTCCGSPDQAVSCTEKTAPPLTRAESAALLPDCHREMLEDASCDSDAFSGANFGSFECDPSGESFCSASDFRPHIPLSSIGGYSAPFHASNVSGYMWGRSAVHDGDHIFVQQSRTGTYGSQYGATIKHGKVLKISKATGAVVASQTIDGRWAPTIAKGSDGIKYVFVVHSHFMAHQDWNGLTGAWFNGVQPPDAGAYAGRPASMRLGHWIYKLAYDTLAVVAKREVSVDHDLVEPRLSQTQRDAVDFSSFASTGSYLASTVGTTQLNGFLGKGTEETLCPGGELLFTGISGYPYYYGFSDEPQSRPVGMYNQRNTGRGMAYCSSDLLPKWDNPASNGWMQVPHVDEANGNPAAADYLGAGKKRHLVVGDKIPAAKLRPGQTKTAVAADFDCSAGATGTNSYALADLLAKEYTLVLDAAVDLADEADVTATVVGDPTAQVTLRTASASAASTEVVVSVVGGDYRPFGAGSKLMRFGTELANVVGVSKALVEIPHVTNATAADAGGVRWENVVAYNEQLLDVVGGAVSVYRATPCAPPILDLTKGAPASSYPNFPPQIKVKKSAGARIDTEGERVSLQQHGGSWWFRVSVADGMLVTPQGNGHMESIDRYQVFRDFYLRRDVVHNALIVLSRRLAAEGDSASLKAEFLARMAERHAMIGERRALFQSLSPVDYAGVESAVAAYNVSTGERIWVTSGEAPDVWNVDKAIEDYGTLSTKFTSNGVDVTHHTDAFGFWSHLDAEANNAIVVGDRVVYTTKGASIGTLDAKTGAPLKINATSIWSDEAEGHDAAGNFGGLCYAGGQQAVTHSATNSFDYLHPITKERVIKDHAVLAGYDIPTGKITWYKDIDANQAAVGLVCAKGMVFTLLPSTHAMGVFDAFTGAKLQELPLPAAVGMGAPVDYNRAQIVVDRRDVYLVSTHGVTKYRLVLAGAGTGV